ncbi:uncharacterized protein LOC132714268 [Ruditapes philippinarum]|uniref:uncharacterized protein LOC132714268 n=1 Tax=Ruditapes philippinarum TaxID=129788 RepID=UPI00295B1746|nr:uncharacterized protein LOC132714268 [Ruditapes philippinarum]
MYAPLRNVNSGNFSLEELNNLEVKELIPAIMYIIVLMICGVIGNSLVLYIYYFRFKPSNHRYFILTLGVCDFITSAVCMPFLIADALHPFMFTSIITCKIFRYITYNTALISIFTLFVIAVERYRKICKPLHNQITLPFARRILVGIVFLTSTVFALPSFILYGHTSVSTGYGNTSGVACFTDDKFCDTRIPMVYNSILFVIVFILGTVMVFCYTKIAHQRHIRAKFSKARKRYVFIESSGNFISEQSDNCVHTSAINGLKEELRETFNDRSTQTNDSVFFASSSLNKQSNQFNEYFPGENNKSSDGNDRTHFEISETIKYELYQHSTDYSRKKLEGNEKIHQCCDICPNCVKDTQNEFKFQNVVSHYDIIDNPEALDKGKTTDATMNFRVSSLTTVSYCDSPSPAFNETDYLKQTKRRMFQCRRHSMPDILVKHYCDYIFDGKENSLSCITLDLNMVTLDQKRLGHSSKITIEHMSTFTHAEKSCKDVDLNLSEFTQNTYKSKVPEAKMKCQNRNGVNKTCHCYKDEQLGNKTNQRNRKVFIRRNKTKSAKFAKLRDNTLINVTKMLFYITLVYFISFIPHLVLMITLMLDDQFLSSLNHVEVQIFYIALRSFIINAVANPFIYNFMDKQFKKECRQLCNRKKVAK